VGSNVCLDVFEVNKISVDRDFFFACPGFFPFDPFLYCLNPFVLHVTLRSILPSLHNTTQTSMPPVEFFFCLSGFFPFDPFFVLF
jgi:hypothetical protein